MNGEASGPLTKTAAAAAAAEVVKPIGGGIGGSGGGLGRVSVGTKFAVVTSADDGERVCREQQLQQVLLSGVAGLRAQEGRNSDS